MLDIRPQISDLSNFRIKNRTSYILDLKSGQVKYCATLIKQAAAVIFIPNHLIVRTLTTF